MLQEPTQPDDAPAAPAAPSTAHQDACEIVLVCFGKDRLEEYPYDVCNTYFQVVICNFLFYAITSITFILLLF
jgi:hypothetical protein